MHAILNGHISRQQKWGKERRTEHIRKVLQELQIGNLSN